MARGGRVIYKRTGGRKRKTGSRAAADDDDDDEDEEYVLGDEDDEESESLEESYASSRDASEEEFEFGESNSGSDEEEEEMEVEDEEEEEEAEIELARSKPRRGASNGWRTVKKPRVLDDEEEEEVSVPRKRARGGSRQKKSRVSDYEEEEDDDDEDFSPDEDEDEEEEVALISGTRSGCGRKGDSKRGRKKRASGVSKQKRKKKTARVPSRKRRRRAWISDEDDDFIVKDRIAVDKKRKKIKKRTKKKTTTSRAARKISPVDSETSDFDYVTSDDDFAEKDKISLDNRRKKNKEGRKKTTTPRTGKKRPSSVESDSESSDYDYVISEEELKDLGVGGVLSEPQPKRISAGRKSEEKGKAKEADESGKQICGICLSEEQKGTTVQGVLNCCAHYFCLACIMEWSKVESRCPVCKRRFMTITRSARSDWGVGLRKAVIKVQKRDQVYQPSEEEMRVWLDPYENVVCMECQQGEDDNLMLLCDICDSSAHTYCVGLGKEVPEGNWYCELCRSAGEGSSYSQVQDAPTNQGASRGDLFPGGLETEGVSRNMSASMNSQRSVPLTGQSSQGIDLNVSPRHFAEEDNGAASHASGGGASTLSGRRAIHRRIRILLSNSRPRQIFARVNIPWRNVEGDATTSGIEQSGEASRVTVGVNSLHSVSSIEQQQQQNIRTFQSSANLAPSMYSEGNSLRHVEGAKEEVQSMVKSHLTNLCRDFPLERATFKEIARRSTHTILAACGIEHRRRMVAAPVQPPNNCPHVIYHDESAYLMKGCCSSCFSSFVKGVVQKIMQTTSSQS